MSLHLLNRTEKFVESENSDHLLHQLEAVRERIKEILAENEILKKENQRLQLAVNIRIVAPPYGI